MVNEMKKSDVNGSIHAPDQLTVSFDNSCDALLSICKPISVLVLFAAADRSIPRTRAGCIYWACRGGLMCLRSRVGVAGRHHSVLRCNTQFVRALQHF